MGCTNVSANNLCGKLIFSWAHLWDDITRRLTGAGCCIDMNIIVSAFVNGCKCVAPSTDIIYSRDQRVEITEIAMLSC